MNTKTNLVEKIKSWVFYFLVSAIIFLVVTIPFRKVFAVFPVKVTEIRPAGAFPPVFAVLFGIPGALGCAVANLIADIIFGYSVNICLLGFPIQFLYGFLSLFLWRLFRKNDDDKINRLNSSKKVFELILCFVSSVIVVSLLLGFLMDLNEIAEIFSTETLFIFLNNIVFSIVLGIPIFIFVSFINQWKKAKNNISSKTIKFSLNEKFLLIFFSFSIILTAIISFSVFLLTKNNEESLLIIWNRIYLYTDISLMSSILISFLYLIYLEKSITMPVEKMAHMARHYADREDEVLNSEYIIKNCRDYISYMSEIGDLARSYVYMAKDMETSITRLKSATDEKDTYRSEITSANRIQRNLTPQLFPAFISSDKVDVYASIQFSSDFSGDFYDYFMVDDKHLAIVMADVSGKGVSAALYMAICRTLIKDKILEGLLPEEVFADVNNQLSKDNKENMFVAAWFGLLDIESGELVYVNAGMMQPLISKGGADYSFIEEPENIVLAISDETLYTQNTIQLTTGDRIILYTKGIPDAKNITNQNYGKGNLLNFVNHNKQHSTENLAVGLQRDISLFMGETVPADDLTLLILEYKN